MNEFYVALTERFGPSDIQILPADDSRKTELITIRLHGRIPQTILMTKGLHSYQMPVPERYADRAHHELFMLLPDYWDLNEPDNPRMNWVTHWLDVLAQRVVDKQLWHGPGHTIPAGNPEQAISETMKQKYFFLAEPISLKQKLTPIQLNEFAVHFLAVIPIFDEELDYKMAKGAHKLHKKFNQHNITEELDDFRRTALKTRWRFFG